jgi:DNA-binding response OmpR family regulator
MSTQPRSDLKSTAPTRVSRNAMNPFRAKDLTALAAGLRQARYRADTVSRARRPLLAGAHRDLREPLTAMLRLNNDWDVRWTDMVAVRMIEQQRQALEVMADLIDSFLTIAEPPTEEWSAEWSMISAVDRHEVPVAVGPASRVRCVLLVNEDRGVLGALRIYLLCAGYRVFAAANADEALDRAWMARMATSLIDIIIVNSDLTGDDDGLAVIDKTRLLLGYNVPAVLLTSQTSIDIGKAALVTDVSLLRNPVNLDELNALISEVLKRPRRSRLARLRATGVKLVHDGPNPDAPLKDKLGHSEDDDAAEEEYREEMAAAER